MKKKRHIFRVKNARNEDENYRIMELSEEKSVEYRAFLRLKGVKIATNEQMREFLGIVPKPIKFQKMPAVTSQNPDGMRVYYPKQQKEGFSLRK